MDKFYSFLYYVEDRLKEPSTWQGLGFLIVTFGSYFGMPKFGTDLDWGQCAVIGGFLSAAMKMIIPDKKPDISTEDKAVITASVTADVKADIKAAQ